MPKPVTGFVILKTVLQNKFKLISINGHDFIKLPAKIN
jgi:hypothetical protein